jgi:hypothetical protein
MRYAVAVAAVVVATVIRALLAKPVEPPELVMVISSLASRSGKGTSR